MPTRKILLVFSQTFVPDPASVGQHMTDVAAEMARRGYGVRVYASSRGYENPKVLYPRRETLRGMDIRRLSYPAFGKKNLLLRALGSITFLIQCSWHALFTPNVAGIFFSTSPPMMGFVAAVAKRLRGIPIAYWAMDLNPDQLIAMGKLKEKALLTRMIEAANRFILKQSDMIVSLDRFMAGRLLKRGDFASKMLVMPPWPHEDHMGEPPAGENAFRKEHGLGSDFVVMYSGNHSPANPLKTLLEAAVKLKDEPGLKFLFVGGGLGKKEVEQYKKDHNLQNLISLPYQPLERLGESLGSADVHVVSLGNEMVGIVHPCKIYGAMAVGRPILYLGPRPSHVSDILEQHHIGWNVQHGDVDGTVAAIRSAIQVGATDRTRMGNVAREVLQTSISQQILCRRFCDGLESALRLEAQRQPQPAPSVSS